MELVTYLNDNFLTLTELLTATEMKLSTFRGFQDQRLMPKASYVVDLQLSSDSFFGHHSETHNLEYYAKGYVSWLGIIEALKDPKKIYSVFTERYKSTMSWLKDQGYDCVDVKENISIDKHIREEWDNFIDGTYGLCTKSGLPEDIAKKEIAILNINALSENKNVSNDKNLLLTRAVNLLDEASSEFAPHERMRSSRQKFVNEVRRKYQLN